MKQCPICGTTYTDATLRFCLSDGAPLNEQAGEQPTLVRKTASDTSDEKTVAMHGEPLRIEIPHGTALPPHPSKPAGASGVLKVLLILLGLGILVALVALIGTLAYFYARPDRAANEAPEPKTSNSSSAPANDGKDTLRDQIANLQKQLAEQKGAGRPSEGPVATPDVSTASMTTTVRANSPNDGFLALRSLPSAQYGDRILKIPHGAALQIGACGPVEHSVHPGRWCQARYNGQSGYIYDYYVTY
jgi:hypothetical protein